MEAYWRLVMFVIILSSCILVWRHVSEISRGTQIDQRGLYGHSAEEEETFSDLPNHETDKEEWDPRKWNKFFPEIMIFHLDDHQDTVIHPLEDKCNQPSLVINLDASKQIFGWENYKNSTPVFLQGGQVSFTRWCIALGSGKQSESCPHTKREDSLW